MHEVLIQNVRLPQNTRLLFPGAQRSGPRLRNAYSFPGYPYNTINSKSVPHIKTQKTHKTHGTQDTQSTLKARPRRMHHKTLSKTRRDLPHTRANIVADDIYNPSTYHDSIRANEPPLKRASLTKETLGGQTPPTRPSSQPCRTTRRAA